VSIRPPIVPIVIIVASLIALGAFSAGAGVGMMGGRMSNGHWGMMGGRGSDPAEETAVADVTAVRMEDFAFSPANIVIDAGTTVTWTNYDGVGHTVTSDDGDELDSSLFARGETYSHTFETEGTFAYHCKPHPYMQGLVTVRAVERASAPPARGSDGYSR
jgi:plastocyanin